MVIRKGIVLGILWGLVSWLPYHRGWPRVLLWTMGLPAALSRALSALVALPALAGSDDASLLLFSVPVGALVGLCVSLAVERRRRSRRM